MRHAFRHSPTLMNDNERQTQPTPHKSHESKSPTPPQHPNYNHRPSKHSFQSISQDPPEITSPEHSCLSHPLHTQNSTPHHHPNLTNPNRPRRATTQTVVTCHPPTQSNRWRLRIPTFVLHDHLASRLTQWEDGEYRQSKLPLSSLHQLRNSQPHANQFTVTTSTT